MDLRHIISDAKLLSSEETELQKPDYLYGDAIADRDAVMSRDGSPWLRLVDGRIMLLPAMLRRYSLLKLGQMSVPRLMAEDLTPVVDKIGSRDGSHSCWLCEAFMALLPGLRSRDLPAEEVPVRANTAIN